MSDTPMTDAVIANDDGGLGYIAELARLARKLERENAEMKAELHKSNAACAEMREVLEWTAGVAIVESREDVMEALMKALSNDIGKGWLSPEQAKFVVDGYESLKRCEEAKVRSAEANFLAGMKMKDAELERAKQDRNRIAKDVRNGMLEACRLASGNTKTN